MKKQFSFIVVLLVAMIVPQIAIGSEHGLRSNFDVLKNFLAGSALTYLLAGMSRDIIREIAVSYINKYEELIKNKIFSEQLKILEYHKSVINRYTSPLEAKVLYDIMWLSKAVSERCLALTQGKSPVEQVIVLKSYIKLLSSLETHEDYYNTSLLFKSSWFARQFYRSQRFLIDHDILFERVFFADKSIEKCLIDGFVQEIIKKNNLKTRYTAADVKRYQAGVPLKDLLDVTYP